MFRQPYLHTANIRECCVSMVVWTCYITIIYKYTLCVDIHTRGKQHTYNLAYIITKILLCNDSSKISEPQIIFTKMIYFSCFPKSQSKIISRSIHFEFTLTFGNIKIISSTWKYFEQHLHGNISAMCVCNVLTRCIQLCLHTICRVILCDVVQARLYTSCQHPQSSNISSQEYTLQLCRQYCHTTYTVTNIRKSSVTPLQWYYLCNVCMQLSYNLHTRCLHTLLTSANALYYNHSQEYICEVVQTSCLNRENIFTEMIYFFISPKSQSKIEMDWPWNNFTLTFWET